jgi:hypothetical protein
MKRRRSQREELAANVTLFLEEAKRSDDSRYIGALEEMVVHMDNGQITCCEQCKTRFCYFEDEYLEVDDPWRCLCCGGEGRRSAQLCIICMPSPYDVCSKCFRRFCGECTYNATHHVCSDCAYDEDDLDVL